MACDKQLLLHNAWLRAQTIGRVHYAAQMHALRCGGMGDAASQMPPVQRRFLLTARCWRMILMSSLSSE